MLNYVISRETEDVNLIKSYHIAYCTVDKTSTGGYKVIVTEDFDRAPVDVQKFLLTLMEAYIYNKLTDEEADKYAVKLMGKEKCINALKWIKNDAHNISYSGSSLPFEIGQRIYCIENDCTVLEMLKKLRIK